MSLKDFAGKNTKDDETERTAPLEQCCLFSYDTVDEAVKNMGFEEIENYGGSGEGYSWNDGRRALIRCGKCGALFLRQDQEFLSMSYADDSIRYVYLFPFATRQEAMEYNAKYKGFEWVNSYSSQKIWFDGSKWCWNK